MRQAFVVAALLMVACSPSGKGAAQSPSPEASPAVRDIERHPVSGLEIIEVAVLRGDERVAFKTELANTPEAQRQGMMFRTDMGDDEAMLFPSGAPALRSFWMKNTPLALDIIFIGPDGAISNIEAGVPYSLDSVQSVGLASAVLEIRGGLAEELGIVPGDRVEYTVAE
ncbi:MAG: DUF192 domain-containing protein [Pseudomonadota bacterium]